MTQVGFTLKVRLGGLNRAATPDGRPVGRAARRVRGFEILRSFLLRAWPLRIPLVADWQDAGLVKPSVLKPVFTTIEQGLVVRTMGTRSNNDLCTLRETLAQAIG